MPKRQSTSRPHADAFFDIFESARVRSGYVASRMLRHAELCDFSPASACFHFVEDARCVLHAAGSVEAVLLQSGDLVILPQGRRHRLEHADDANGTARITTGEFQLEGPSGKLLASALPALLHVPDIGTSLTTFPDSPSDWLSVTLAAIRLEGRQPSLGSSVMVSRLIDLLFVWALRHWLSSASPHQSKWIRALDDAVVGRALTLMHAQPALAWSVDMLARQLNQSRSGFSQRFVAIMDEPPMRYLTRWRMQLAADLLASTRLRISQVARRVGYDSEPSFSRAFRRHTNMAPVDYRRRL